jgi:ribosomal protein L11 methyltransferase
VLMDTMEAVFFVTNKNGYVLLSGFYEEDAEALMGQASNFGLLSLSSTVRNKWCSILLRK